MLGIGFGIVLSLVVSDRRAGVWKESAAIAVVAVVAVGYFSTDSVGGSGYLGAFLAGLSSATWIVSGSRDAHGARAGHALTRRDTITEVVVILVFVTLGANLPWTEVWDNVAPALSWCRSVLCSWRVPSTVLLCLWARPARAGGLVEEIAFLAWTRETGVVAAALAGLMVARGIPDSELIVTTVAVAIVLTLAVQTTTRTWLGRRLGLDESDFRTRGTANSRPDGGRRSRSARSGTGRAGAVVPESTVATSRPTPIIL